MGAKARVTGYRQMETLEYTIFGVLVLSLLVLWGRLSDKMHHNLRRVVTRVADNIYAENLAPVRDSVYRVDDDGQRYIDLNDHLVRAVVEYVEKAHRILQKYHSKNWDGILASDKFLKALSTLEKDPEYVLWRTLEDRFVNDLPASITGQDLHDPFAFWVQCLYRCLKVYQGFRTEDIKEVWICKHGDIIFKTPARAYNERHVGTNDFKCDVCTQPEEVIKVG